MPDQWTAVAAAIDHRLAELGWDQAELVRASGLSDAVVRRTMDVHFEPVVYDIPALIRHVDSIGQRGVDTSNRLREVEVSIEELAATQRRHEAWLVAVARSLGVDTTVLATDLGTDGIPVDPDDPRQPPEQPEDFR